MKKVRLLPFILALSLPTSGCSFSDLMFWKKKDQPSDQQSDKNATGIKEVHVPEQITKGETLKVSDVELIISYSDSSTGTVNPEKVTLDTSSVGTKTGTAFYGQFYKDFEIEVVEGEEVSTKTFNEIKNDILINHNYTLDIESYYVNFPTERYDGYMYNISDKAYYGKDPNYSNLWDSGYIKVKDQGIAEFYWSLANNQVILGSFIASNPERTIYDVESLLVEFLLESELTKVSDTHYTSSDQDLIGMMANFSGLELTYVSNPESLDIKQVGDNLKVEFTLRADYRDEETLDPVQNEPVYVGVTIKNIGSTHNSVIEAFVEDESKKVSDPTSWDSYAQNDFVTYYDGFIPPFPTGATYSFSEFAKWDGYEQKYFIKTQDLRSGDLRTSYASQLTSQNFTLQDGVYRKIVENDEHTLRKIYEAKMIFYDESSPYGGQTYGYYFLGGVFQVEYTMYTEVIAAVTNIESLNSYVATTAAASIVPVFPEAYNSTSVTHFDDHTETLNQLYPGSFLFVTSSTGYFRIHLTSFADALAFYNELVSRSTAKGFTSVSSSSGLTIMKDSADSKISITDITAFTADTYGGYLQCQIYIRNNYTEYYSVTLNKDDGVNSALVVSPANYMKVEEGQKVTFTISIAEGYELDEISFSVGGITPTEESAGRYSFNMPAHNVTINVTTRSQAASEGLVYDKEYLVFVGRTSNNQYYERPTTEGSNKLHFIFKSDGTGTFTYTWFNTSGEVNAGPYTVEFNYTLISGAFMITCTDGDNNALFGNFRLFIAGTEGNYNETGRFNNNEITITLSNGSGTTTEVTLK